MQLMSDGFHPRACLVTMPANGGPLGFSTTPPARSRSTSSGGERSEAGTARTITVARLVAEHNEDVYRLLHHCLAPLAPSLGVVPYSDRIHATVAAPPPVLGADARSGGRTGEYRTERWRRMPVVELATDGIAISPSAMSISAGEMSISGTQAMRLIHLYERPRRTPDPRLRIGPACTNLTPGPPQVRRYPTDGRLRPLGRTRGSAAARPAG